VKRLSLAFSNSLLTPLAWSATTLQLSWVTSTSCRRQLSVRHGHRGYRNRKPPIPSSRRIRTPIG